MNRSLKKIWNVISSILVAVVVLLALLLVGARIVGLQVFTVLSGSMEPTYHTGSLIYVKKVDPYTIEVGQPITFMLDESTIATHRVVGIVPDEEDPSVIRFRTKGDANEAEDGSLVHYKNVIGTPIFSIPYLGYVADYIQHPPGTYVAISAGAVLLLLVFLPDVFADDKDLSILSTGGFLRSPWDELTGNLALKAIENLNADIFFFLVPVLPQNRALQNSATKMFQLSARFISTQSSAFFFATVRRLISSFSSALFPFRKLTILSQTAVRMIRTMLPFSEIS